MVFAQVACTSPVVPLVDGQRFVIAEGDWNDLDAAVEVAAKQTEMALVERVTPPDSAEALTRVRFRLVTATDEPVQLIISREAFDDADPMSQRPRLDAKVGRFGDAEMESRLLRAVARRLKELHGVDTAPVGG